MTPRDMVKWIAANVPQERREGQTPLKAACWWAAYTEAEDWGDLSTRDRAEALLSGFQGYKTLKDLESPLEDVEDDELIESWKEFWEIGERR